MSRRERGDEEATFEKIRRTRKLIPKRDQTRSARAKALSARKRRQKRAG